MALAHDVAHPRHELLRISRDGVRLLVDYEVPAGPRAQALRQALRSPAALTEHLSRTATLRTALSLDGAPAALERRAVRAEKVDEPPSSPKSPSW